jgi:exopolyphosphatase/guanosine-5'-triphosphate,3'-diphosphate pyrophosphatase
MRVAALDIGSNTLLMLVVDDDGGELTAVVDRCEFGRLGQGVDRSGALSGESIERSLEILSRFAAEAGELGVERVGAVGTQALREADNAADFVDPAAEILGAPIEIIEGKREAELVYRATAREFPGLAAETLVIADVGGGSTEIDVGRGGELVSAVSVPIGAVRLSERHLASDPPIPAEVRALIADIDAALADLELPSGVPLVGTAGTATSFASVELRLAEYDGDRVQGLSLTPAQVDRHLARFLEMTVAEKRALVGLEPARADVIAGGAAIYARLLHRMQAPRFVVSDRGVRWGLAAELTGAS